LHVASSRSVDASLRLLDARVTADILDNVNANIVLIIYESPISLSLLNLYIKSTLSGLFFCLYIRQTRQVKRAKTTDPCNCFLMKFFTSSDTQTVEFVVAGRDFKLSSEQVAYCCKKFASFELVSMNLELILLRMTASTFYFIIS